MTNEQKEWTIVLCIEHAKLKNSLIFGEWTDAQKYQEAKIKLDGIENKLIKLGFGIQKAGE